MFTGLCSRVPVVWICANRVDDSLLTFSMSSSALSDITSIVVPMMSCMGIIHDLRRPIERKKTESTMGDQKSLSEYG